MPHQSKQDHVYISFIDYLTPDGVRHRVIMASTDNGAMHCAEHVAECMQLSRWPRHVTHNKIPAEIAALIVNGTRPVPTTEEFNLDDLPY